MTRGNDSNRQLKRAKAEGRYKPRFSSLPSVRECSKNVVISPHPQTGRGR